MILHRRAFTSARRTEKAPVDGRFSAVATAKGGKMISRVYCSAQALCFAMLLAACGGGGGGSSAPDFSTAPGLTVSPANLSFAAVHNGALPPTQNIQITVSHPNFNVIIVGFPTGVTPPTWLDQNPSRFTGGGGNNWTFTAAISSTSLAPGTYTTTIRVVIGDVNQNILALRDVQVSYTVTSAPAAASPNALNFSSVAGGAAPAAQTVALMGDVGAWTASPNQTWIGVGQSSGFGAGNVGISVNPAGLGPNTYNGSVTFNTAGGPTSVSVTFVVAPTAIQPSLDSLTFSGVNGATLASQSLNITMNNGAALSWTANPADSWLVLNRTSGTASDPLGVSVNPANGALASGTYNSSIGLQASSGGSTFNKTVNVTMTLTKATLTANPAGVTLGGSNGRDFSGVPVQLSLNTGANSFAWTSTPSASFIQRSPVSGSTAATPLTVTLAPNASGLTGGTHNGSVNFTLQVNGDTVSNNLPVTFNLEAHKLLVDGNGVAFANTPGISKLTRTVQVRDNLGVSRRSLDIVREAMLSETEDPEGTGKHVLGSGIHICGKTGTAERKERGETRNTVWFVSYAPYDKPQYAVVVMVEDGQSGGATCAPPGAADSPDEVTDWEMREYFEFF